MFIYTHLYMKSNHLFFQGDNLLQYYRLMIV